jgi:hypothetical protein
MKRFMLFLFFLYTQQQATSQQIPDSQFVMGKTVVTLSTVVLNAKLDVPSFISRIKDDTTFYKAFRNLRMLQFSAINDIRINDKNEKIKASLYSKTVQVRSASCRRMQVLEEKVTGDFYDAYHNYNYYTAQMYAALFFTKDSVCGEDNIVAGIDFTTTNKKGIDKHKEQLKKLFFNPGKKIKGLPFISNKTAIFDNDVAANYNMNIDADVYNGTNCYIFKQTVKPGVEDKVVIDSITTWFDEITFDVMARTYSLSYQAGVYDFEVQMEVQLKKFEEFLVPTLLRYYGNWKAILKPRERGVFTATLFDFKR